MSWIAFKMLTGDRNKFLGIVFGVMFASLLISHQISIFVGILGRTTSQITDVLEPDIFVMDPKVRYIEEVPALLETDLQKVRGVEGVAWGVRMFKGLLRARLDDGNFRQVIVLGIDDATMVGAPREMVMGKLSDLRRPDAIVIDDAGYTYMWPDQPLELGKVIEMNDRRAVLVGICKASAPFVSAPIIYTRYTQAVRFAPPERNQMSFVLAKGDGTMPIEALCDRIRERTGLQALTHAQFSKKTVGFYLAYTGIPVNFGITVLLGFIVGVAIAGQTFYLFTVENLKQFGALKAMGVSNWKLVGMILLQAFIVGILGYCIGIGLTALFFESTKNQLHLAGFFLPWQVMVLTAAAVLVIVLLASLLSMRKVLVLEPAVVFRG
jgi:putative ABC transport system permease protein